MFWRTYPPTKFASEKARRLAFAYNLAPTDIRYRSGKGGRILARDVRREQRERGWWTVNVWFFVLSILLSLAAKNLLYVPVIYTGLCFINKVQL